MKHIVVSAVVTLSVFCAVLYSSCAKDGCKSVTCFNYGSCSGGLCTCLPGIGGNNCEIVYRRNYAHQYRGNTPGNTGHSTSNNVLTFTEGDTTNYNNMQLEWDDAGTLDVKMPIVLSNNSTSGSSFTVTSTTYNYKTYTGAGSLSSTSATLHLTETDTTGHSVYLTFENFYRQ